MRSGGGPIWGRRPARRLALRPPPGGGAEYGNAISHSEMGPSAQLMFHPPLNLLGVCGHTERTFWNDEANTDDVSTIRPRNSSVNRRVRLTVCDERLKLFNTKLSGHLTLVMVNQLDMKLQQAWRFEQGSPGLFQTDMDPSYIYSTQDMRDHNLMKWCRLSGLCSKSTSRKQAKKTTKATKYLGRVHKSGGDYH
jgi:hypothetical protein